MFTKIYDKRDGFNFDIVNIPFLDSDISRSMSYDVFISQLIRFARVCCQVEEFNIRNLILAKNYVSKAFDIISYVNHSVNFVVVNSNL